MFEQIQERNWVIDKKLIIFNPKNCFQGLINIGGVRDPGSRGRKNHRIPDPDPRTL